MEVSSYQLEIPNKYFSPSVSRIHVVSQAFIIVLLQPTFLTLLNFQVSVILNLTPDHLERHKSMKNYSSVKCRIFSHMSDRKMAILPMGMTSNSNSFWLGYYKNM